MSLFRACRMLALLLAGCAIAASAQKAETVPVVMLSDIHFDPFHDPAKFEQLRAAPALEWEGILDKPDPPALAAASEKQMAACKLQCPDTPWTLLHASLLAAQAQSPNALFVTVSGDLLAHDFRTRFDQLAHTTAQSDQPEYSDFATKAVAYVVSDLHRVFGKTPVYIGLGNNDSGCDDYHENPDSSFLKTVMKGLGNDSESPVRGNYSVDLPKPIVNGRLIVLQDIFLSDGYKGCDGTQDPKADDDELKWLRRELDAAHTEHQQVWVMAHIPPGVNVYSTVKKDACAKPAMFLSDDRLNSALTEYAADIRLAIFAHTHDDEMKLLQNDAKTERVAAKLVPSVTPFHGNYPAFTLAEVDPRTAVMKDYRVIAADNKTGIGTKWSEGYRFSTAYQRSAYTPAELASLIADFSADKAGTSPKSSTYEQNFSVGGGMYALALRLVWPQYVCSMQNNTEAAYHGCVCPAKP
jgi:sphingomyelin phosphodiesterase acid-like 3